MTSAKKIFTKIGSVLSTILVVAAAALCVLVVGKSMTGREVTLFNCRCFYVVTGSMEPTIHVGAAVIVKPTSDGIYEVGDIITFVSSTAEIAGQPNTHRIVGVSEINGQRLYITKGDANNTQDAEPVSASDIYGKVVWHTGSMKWFGTFMGFITTKYGFVCVIILPVLLITGSQLREFTQEYKKALRAAALPADDEDEDDDEYDDDEFDEEDDDQ